MAFKVLIADDDPAMRMILKKIVEQTEGFAVIDEAADGAQAVAKAAALKPDVIFLDVEMPKLSGVEAAKVLSSTLPGVHLIIATAHAQYMPDAFEVYAADYLIKPFKIDRVKQTLLKIAEEESSRQKASLPMRQKLLIRSNDGMAILDTGDIIMIQREERATVIYTAEGSYTTSDGLNKLWEKLDPAVFMRSHRSFIINTTAIRMIYPYGRWTYIVKFRDCPQDALITHEKFEELQSVIEG